MVEEDKQKLEVIQKALENPNYTWRTISGIAKDSHLSTSEVMNVIAEDHDWLVKSSVPSNNGESLFSTRAHVRSKSSTLEKLAGAFKMRIR